MPEVVIETRELTKRYKNGVVALQNLNLKIEEGDCVGYLGPNGAGKTTTIKQKTQGSPSLHRSAGGGPRII